MPLSEPGTVHVIGAGVAGLAAAVRLAGGRRHVELHEATLHPGGRCRSFYDPATGLVIDNGTHLVLSGNAAVLSFAATIGARDRLQGPPRAAFSFADFSAGERWTLDIGRSRLPWWLFDPRRRPPQTRARDYLSLARLAWQTQDRPIGEVIDTGARAFQRMLAPLLLAALNIAPPLGSSRLAAALLQETLARGGETCRPLLAVDGLDAAFIAPALAHLQRHGATVRRHDELVACEFANGRVEALIFVDRRVKLGEGDSVVLAVPPQVAAKLVPGLTVPDRHCGILNAHFRCDPPAGFPAMLGVLNGTCEWIFARPGRFSVTISDASRYFDQPRDRLAASIWAEVATLADLPAALPPWQIVRERRATFAATPDQNRRRPGALTAWRNLMLAGDWTDTGLPATLEGAVRSGHRAADLLLQARKEAA